MPLSRQVRGVNVGSLPLSNLVPFIRCIEDGGIYKKDRGYILKGDNNGYESLFPTHTHDPDNEATDGGAHYYVRKLNSKHLLDFNNQSVINSILCCYWSFARNNYRS